MKFTLRINDLRSINDIPGYWSDDDYIKILEELDVSDARNASSADLRELFDMAVSDLEPHEAAELMLRHKLGDELNAGQIQNISYEMIEDNEAEENANIGLHYTLFNINQLLRRAYNGKFPNSKATWVEMTLNLKGEAQTDVTKELALKALCCGLSDNSPILRLFEEQLNGDAPFDDADKIVWELHHRGDHNFTLITSDYWISKEDFVDREFSGAIKLCDDEQD